MKTLIDENTTLADLVAYFGGTITTASPAPDVVAEWETMTSEQKKGLTFCEFIETR